MQLAKFVESLFTSWKKLDGWLVGVDGGEDNLGGRGVPGGGKVIIKVLSLPCLSVVPFKGPWEGRLRLMLCTTILQNLMGVTICDPREGKKRNTQISHYNHDFYHLHHHDLNQLNHQRVGVYPTTLGPRRGSVRNVLIKACGRRLL